MDIRIEKLSNIRIEKLTRREIEKKEIKSWDIWEKGVFRFNRFYKNTEECYFLKGRVIIELDDEQKIEIKAGDYVLFPKGLSCVWDIKEPVKKHFHFVEE